jgi:hypothetical protein
MPSYPPYHRISAKLIDGGNRSKAGANAAARCAPTWKVAVIRVEMLHLSASGRSILTVMLS